MILRRFACSSAASGTGSFGFCVKQAWPFPNPVRLLEADPTVPKEKY